MVDTRARVMFLTWSVLSAFMAFSSRRGRAVLQIGSPPKRSGRVVPALILLAAFQTGPVLAASTPRDLSLQGRDKMESGDLKGALDSFRGAREGIERASVVDRELIDYLALHLYNLGVSLNNAGDADGALDSFLEVLRLTDRAPGIRDKAFRTRLIEGSLEVAGYLVSSGRPDRPAEVYGLLERMAPIDARPRIGLGSAALAQGDLARAEEAFSAAAELAPNNPEVAAGFGRVALRTARYLDQVSAARGGGDPLPAYARAIYYLGRARDMEPATASRERELAGALEHYSRALARAGEAHDASLRFIEAERAYRRAVALEPDNPWHRLELATFVFAARRYAEASEQFAQVEESLHLLMEQSPDNRNAGAWSTALQSCRENRAAAAYNLAVDALNRADYARIDPLLEEACGMSEAWRRTCESFRQVAHDRREFFEKTVANHVAALASDPERASNLLALGDLYADLGAYDRSLPYYRRLEELDAKLPGLPGRIAGVVDLGDLPAMTTSIEVPRGRIDLVYYSEDLKPDLEQAVEAAWLRVSTALGDDALAGSLAITVYANKRAFREQAGYRVGGLVKGYYGMGRISVYETPSHTVLEWISVLTHEMAHHAVERISGGRCPRWLSEGVARYVQGDSTVIDRDRLQERLATASIYPISSLDDVMERSWNDPTVYLDALDSSLLAVEQMARGGGVEGIRRLLEELASPGDDVNAVVNRVFGLGLAEIDARWRAELTRP